MRLEGPGWRVVGAAGAWLAFTFFNALLLRAVMAVQQLGGSCASGGPYVSARPCPDGTGTVALILTASIIVYVIATIAAAFQDQAAGGFWFGMLLTVLGGAFLASAITDHAPQDGGVGWFLGALFLAMGVLPATGSIILMVRGRAGGAVA